MIEALASPAPAGALAEELRLFGQFVGKWDVEVSYIGPDGVVETRAGEWIFGWVLEGRAVQDVWRVPSRAESARTGAPIHGYGTTLRFYDASIGAWRSTWHGVVKNEVIPFIGRQHGDEIRLEYAVTRTEIRRWSFSDITPGSFRWRNEHSRDGGASWVLEQTMSAVRST